MNLSVPVSFIAGIIAVIFCSQRADLSHEPEVIKNAWNIVIFSWNVYCRIWSGMQALQICTDALIMITDQDFVARIGMGFSLHFYIIMNNMPTVMIDAIAIDQSKSGHTEGRTCLCNISSDLGPKYMVHLQLCGSMYTQKGMKISWGSISKSR